jgi:hypothetical protein
MRARLEQALAEGRDRDLRGIIDRAPPREAALSAGLVALAAIAAAEAPVPPAERRVRRERRDDLVRFALQKLCDGPSSWRTRDPLAFALAVQVRLRAARATGGSGIGEDVLLLLPDPAEDAAWLQAVAGHPWLPTAVAALPGEAQAAERVALLDALRALSRHDALLRAGPGAERDLWGRELPPAQALAVVLAMREVQGATPDWTLLDSLPAFTVPLRLMRPAAAAGQGGTEPDIH